MLSTKSMGVSISELLSQLGVCERTIYRDLDRLEYAGIPLVRENHRVKLIESTATACLSKHIKGVMMNEELKIKTKPGKLYEVARTLVSSHDSIQSIEPKHLEKWVHSEAKRQGKDIKP
jgi:DeoR/GlpR family transcriptional regulator of sugar metabolism